MYLDRERKRERKEVVYHKSSYEPLCKKEVQITQSIER